jgi:hypothetical protein
MESTLFDFRIIGVVQQFLGNEFHSHAGSWYVPLFELEHFTSREWGPPSPGVAGSSESLIMTWNLSPERALIFRIVHVSNVSWILEHRGLHCPSSSERDSNYVNIGNAELIEKRSRRIVPIPPGGTLSDYVPFYFTPFSMMMYKIKTGHGGIARRENRDIAIFVSSIHRLNELCLTFVFTNQHAYPPDTEFYARVADLDNII